MDSLEQAIKTTERLRDDLLAEVERAREERTLIRQMDVQALNERAALRGRFNQSSVDLQQLLARQLKSAGDALGLTEITLDAIKVRAPRLGGRLSEVLAEVRALAAGLAELDALNRLLGQRTLSYIRAHLAVLEPQADRLRPARRCAGLVVGIHAGPGGVIRHG